MNDWKNHERKGRIKKQPGKLFSNNNDIFGRKKKEKKYGHNQPKQLTYENIVLD